eukprot:jgi/Mesen1/7277/ME000373S06342
MEQAMEADNTEPDMATLHASFNPSKWHADDSRSDDARTLQPRLAFPQAFSSPQPRQSIAHRRTESLVPEFEFLQLDKNMHLFDQKPAAAAAFPPLKGAAAAPPPSKESKGTSFGGIAAEPRFKQPVSHILLEGDAAPAPLPHLQPPDSDQLSDGYLSQLEKRIQNAKDAYSKVRGSEVARALGSGTASHLGPRSHIRSLSLDSAAAASLGGLLESPDEAVDRLTGDSLGADSPDQPGAGGVHPPHQQGGPRCMSLKPARGNEAQQQPTDRRHASWQKDWGRSNGSWEQSQAQQAHKGELTAGGPTLAIPPMLLPMLPLPLLSRSEAGSVAGAGAGIGAGAGEQGEKQVDVDRLLRGAADVGTPRTRLQVEASRRVAAEERARVAEAHAQELEDAIASAVSCQGRACHLLRLEEETGEEEKDAEEEEEAGEREEAAAAGHGKSTVADRSAASAADGSRRDHGRGHPEGTIPAPLSQEQPNGTHHGHGGAGRGARHAAEREVEEETTAPNQGGGGGRGGGGFEGSRTGGTASGGGTGGAASAATAARPRSQSASRVGRPSSQTVLHKSRRSSGTRAGAGAGAGAAHAAAADKSSSLILELESHHRHHRGATETSAQAAAVGGKGSSLALEPESQQQHHRRGATETSLRGREPAMGRGGWGGHANGSAEAAGAGAAAAAPLEDAQVARAKWRVYGAPASSSALDARQSAHVDDKRLSREAGAGGAKGTRSRIPEPGSQCRALAVLASASTRDGARVARRAKSPLTNGRRTARGAQGEEEKEEERTAPGRLLDSTGEEGDESDHLLVRHRRERHFSKHAASGSLHMGPTPVPATDGRPGGVAELAGEGRIEERRRLADEREEELLSSSSKGGLEDGEAMAASASPKGRWDKVWEPWEAFCGIENVPIDELHAADASWQQRQGTTGAGGGGGEGGDGTAAPGVKKVASGDMWSMVNMASSTEEVEAEVEAQAGGDAEALPPDTSEAPRKQGARVQLASLREPARRETSPHVRHAVARSDRTGSGATRADHATTSLSKTSKKASVSNVSGSGRVAAGSHAAAFRSSIPSSSSAMRGAFDAGGRAAKDAGPNERGGRAKPTAESVAAEHHKVSSSSSGLRDASNNGSKEVVRRKSSLAIPGATTIAAHALSERPAVAFGTNAGAAASTGAGASAGAGASGKVHQALLQKVREAEEARRQVEAELEGREEEWKTEVRKLVVGRQKEAAAQREEIALLKASFDHQVDENQRLGRALEEAREQAREQARAEAQAQAQGRDAAGLEAELREKERQAQELGRRLEEALEEADGGQQRAERLRAERDASAQRAVELAHARDLLLRKCRELESAQSGQVDMQELWEEVLKNTALAEERVRAVGLENRQLAAEVSSLRQSNRAQARQLEAMEEQQKKAAEEAAAAAAELKRAHASASACEAKLAEEARAKEAYRQKAEEAVRERERLGRARNKESKRAEGAERERQGLAARLEVALEGRQVAERECRNVEERLGVLEAQLAQAAQSIEALDKKVEDLECQLAEASKSVGAVTLVAEKQEAELERREAQLELLAKQVEDEKLRGRELEADMAEQVEMARQAHAELERAWATIGAVQEELTSLEAHCETLRVRVQLAHAEVQHKEGEVEELESEILWVMSGAEVRAAAERAVHAELADARRLQEELQASVGELRQELVGAQLFGVDLELEMRVRGEKIDELEGEVERRDAQMYAIRRALLETKSERDALMKDVNEWAGEKRRLVKELDQIWRHREALEGEVLAKEGELAILRNDFGRDASF